MDRLVSMTVFARAVELGSFAAAAESLRISPQLAGRHVQALETHLGVKLLARTTRRQRPTDVGARYYEEVKSILANIAAADDMAAQAQDQPRGRLRVSAPVTFGTYALARIIPAFLETYPQVEVELSLSNQVVDLVRDGYDAVLRIGALGESSLVARRLRPYRLVLCAAPAYLATRPSIVHPADLCRHFCLGFAHPQLGTHWTFSTGQGEFSVPVSGRFSADNGESLLAAARAGMGLLLQPEELVGDDLAAGRLVAVLPDFPVPARHMHVLFAPDRRMTPKLRRFVDTVVAAFGPAD